MGNEGSSNSTAYWDPTSSPTGSAGRSVVLITSISPFHRRSLDHALGVAGGELIIPTLVFAFGAGIKTAGTASLLISLPTVAVGVLRHRRLGSFTDRADLTQTVAPMGLGSVIGAVVGGLFVGVVPAAVIKLVLGVILIVSAVRIFYR